jgi:signal transduction histidine kinase
LPERGGLSAAAGTLPASTAHLQIEYGAVSFRGPVSYRYRLTGLDDTWSAPTTERAVTYARLAPGAYRFEVRATGAAGLDSPEAATLEFRILAPVWRRSWFIAAAAFVTIGIGLALHRLRVRQLLALERIRQQVATDLHDDIGSGLSQIAVLSEVASRRVPPGSAPAMHEIAGLARAMRESMGEIVWAIDPRRDRLADLVRRMRHAAFNLLEAADVRVEFVAPDEDVIGKMALGPASRRHVLLAFKEVMTNIARHAHATQVRVDITVGKGTLSMTVADDGLGFDPKADHQGHGLASLKARAAALAGTLDIASSAGRGTTVRFVVPLSGRM